MNISNRIVAVSAVALIGLVVANNVISPSSAPAPNGSTPAPQKAALDFDKPLFLKEGSIACIDPRDFNKLILEPKGFEQLDNGEDYKSCLEWSKRRVRVLDRKDQLFNVISDGPNANDDAWVFESSLSNSEN